MYSSIDFGLVDEVCRIGSPPNALLTFYTASISCLLPRSLLLLSLVLGILVSVACLLLSSTPSFFCFSHGSEAVLPNLCALVSNNLLQFRLLVIKLVFSCRLFIFLYCLSTM